MKLMVVFLFLFYLSSLVSSLDNGLALLPPLLVSTAQVGCNIDEVYIQKQIDYMLTSGLAQIGYKYILIDDCWQGVRDKAGKISEDINKFPSGMKNLVSYAHSKDILVGLGTDIGDTTRKGKNGSKGYEIIDSITYAEWGIDWVNIANWKNSTSVRPSFIILCDYMRSYGKKMISIDNGGREASVNWAGNISNFWTTTGQLINDWQTLQTVLMSEVGLEGYAKSGAWNYAGPLSSSLPDNQFLAQLVTWIGLKSPLTLMTPLSDINKSKLGFLLNSELMTISQDGLKKQAKLLKHQEYQKGWDEVWGGPLSGNRYVLIFINGMSTTSQNLLCISLKKDAGFGSVDSYEIRDPVARATLGSSSSDSVCVSQLGAHAAVVRVLHM